MAKKTKKDKPSILTFLLREMKGKPDLGSEKSEEKENELRNTFFTRASLQTKNKTSTLLPSLLHDMKKRPDPEEEFSQVEKKKPKLSHNHETEQEDDEEEEGAQEDEDKDDDSLLQGRFEVIPSNPLAEDYSKRAATALKNSGTRQTVDKLQTQCTADNYRHMYLLDQRTKEEAPTAEKNRQVEEEKERLDLANKMAEEQKANDAARIRARELQNKIAWWRQQSGLGQYDEATINANIDLLQRELSTIPTGLW